MSKTAQIKVALVVALIAAALVPRPPWATRFTIPLVAFGVFNVLFSAPGTEWIRGAASIGSLAALVRPQLFLAPLIIMSWFAWPPAFAVAWALGRESRDPDEGARARLAVGTVIAAVTVAAIVYRLIVAHSLQQTAALFIGIPAILAMVVVFCVVPESATGVAIKAVTVGLLMSLLFLWEGMLCVLMSAPLFYGIAIGIAKGMERMRRPDDEAAMLRMCLVLLAIVPMSLEGVTEFTTVNRDESVTVTRTIAAPADDVERALFEAPRFDRVLPLYLRSGFPTPAATRIERSGGETRWVIQLRGGEMFLNGAEHRTGDLTLLLEASKPGTVRWRAVSDTSHMTHFLWWREIVVDWHAIDANRTRVSWTLRYQRGLDPAWYFGPMERYAVRLAAGYLIDAVATP
jgi:hypothetical protein